jgi:uncharacterized protein (DUF4415 family)
MSGDKLTTLMAMAKIPGLRSLVIPVENIPDDAEFEALHAEFDAQMELEHQALSAFNPAANVPTSTPESEPRATPAAPTSTRPSQQTTIRIPTVVLAAYKAKARATGTPYQTLMNRALRAASTA